MMAAEVVESTPKHLSVDWKAVRAEFPALANWTYLNSATFGQVPRRSVDAVSRHFAHRDEMACADFLDWFTDMDRVKEAIAKLIGASRDDIAFVVNAAQGLSFIAGGIDWKPGDQVLTLKDEFPNYLALPALTDRFGVEYVEVPWERLHESITPRTRMVAVSEVNYATGFRVPIAELSVFLRERGVVLFVDGTQSCGALRFDCASAKPGAYVVHGYKWMLSPTGAGFLYVDPELRATLPPTTVGWRSDKTWRSVDSLHHGAPRLKDSAEKYEGGGLAIPLLYAMEQSVNLMLEIGTDVIEERVMGLAAKARQILRGLGAVCEETGAQIVTAKFDGLDPSELSVGLRAKRVLVAARHGFLRVSPHLYNNEEDLETLRSELKPLLAR
ncbi:MAG: aminotransferase class V-fold PLP-dependent enzyme [Bryobacteraceae bacterium]